jgi:hypothetical protein
MVLAPTNSGFLLIAPFMGHGQVHMKKIEDKTTKRWCRAKKHLFRGARCAPCAALLESKRPFRPKRLNDVVPITHENLSSRGLDRSCEMCGCPRAFGNCNMCHPLPLFVPCAVLVVACDDEIYSGALWAKPKTQQTRRARYPYSGRSISKEMW